MKILVTGGMGFIGCNFIRYMLVKLKHSLSVTHNSAFPAEGSKFERKVIPCAGPDTEPEP